MTTTLSPTELSLFASGDPSPTADVSYIPVALGITIPSWSLAFITYALRIWSRQRRNNLGWDDHLMTVAVLFAIPNIIIYYVLIFRAGGKKLKDTKDIKILESEQMLSFVLLPLTVFCMSFVKVSACLMILRIKDSKWWKISLWSYNFVIIGFSIGATVAHLTKCQPIRSSWTVLGAIGAEGACWTTDQLLTYSYVLSAFFAATDLIIALLPLAFILKIKRDTREKVMLAFIMSLGLLATGATVAKIPNVSKPFNPANDALWEGYKLITLTMTEISTAIAAANLPCLRFLLRRITRALGWDKSTRPSQRYPPYAYPVGGSGYSGSARRKRDEYDLEAELATDVTGSKTHIASAGGAVPMQLPTRDELNHEDMNFASTDVEWFDMKAQDGLDLPSRQRRWHAGQRG